MKNIFENEKPNLNLNSMRWKQDKSPENNHDLKSFCFEKKVGVQLKSI